MQIILTDDEAAAYVAKVRDEQALLESTARTQRARLADAVTEARTAGVTWDQLARALGVSRQSVTRRFPQ